MNYLAHGFRFLDRPRFMAGTAIPDWLSVCDRKIRLDRAEIRRRSALAAPESADIWAGVVRHLDDDAWFHTNPVFEDVSQQVTRTIRARFPRPKNFRASFLGHVLTELVLDSTLIERDSTIVDRYYAALQSVHAEDIESAVQEITGRVPHRFATFLRRFHESQFIRDYGDDHELLVRLSQVVRRVGLPPLPVDFEETVPFVRSLVARHAEQLVPPLDAA